MCRKIDSTRASAVAGELYRFLSCPQLAVITAMQNAAKLYVYDNMWQLHCTADSDLSCNIMTASVV
jgi:hypothetical protein